MYKKTIYKFFQEKIWKNKIPIAENILSEIKLKLLEYPKTVLSIMVLSIFFSIGSFFYSADPFNEKAHSYTPLPLPINNSVKGIYASVSVIKEILILQQIIDHTLLKDSLSHNDSLLINHTLDKIHVLENMMLKN